MQTQIAELNRQQEEAKRRLLDLLDNQRLQHLRLQEQYDPALTDQDFPHSYAEQNVYNQQYHSKQVGQQFCPNKYEDNIGFVKYYSLCKSLIIL